MPGSRVLIFVDESGDLGWKFSAPYRNGGSSRYLTIASLILDPLAKDRPKRIVRHLYDKFKWPTTIEKKWSEMLPHERMHFAEKAKALIESHTGSVQYHSITVKKPNVQTHIREDSNKLYNYMICLSLAEIMSHHDEVRFYPDPRSIRVSSGNSLHDYLQTHLWFEKCTRTRLYTQPLESSASLNIQFSDMLAGLIQGRYEDGNSDPWKILGTKVINKTLFF